MKKFGIRLLAAAAAALLLPLGGCGKETRR